MQEVSSDGSELVENTKSLDDQEVDNHSEDNVATKHDLNQQSMIQHLNGSNTKKLRIYLKSHDLRHDSPY